jgi:DNA-binding beta-propeller fold protein YncE
VENGGFNGVGAQAQFNLPGAIDISSDGTFAVVADTELHVIRILNMSTGETRLIAGSGTEGYEGWDKRSPDYPYTVQNEGFSGIYGSSAKFKRPSGVALTPDDNFAVVADTGDPENACPRLLRRSGNENRCPSGMMQIFR